MSDTGEVAASWVRIEAWLRKRAKRIHKTLAPGASDEQIAAAERRLGLTLPDDVRASYRVHDGGDESDLFPSSEPEDMGYSLLSLAEMVEAAASQRTWDGWQLAWLPIATNGGGDYQCIDLASNDAGDRGRVLEVNHETREVKVLAASWAARQADLAAGLEARKYKYDADDGIIRPAPPDPFKELRAARKLIEEDATLPPLAHAPLPAPPEYAQSVKLVDPEGTRFGPASLRRQMAIRWFRGSSAVSFYFTYSEPTSVLDLHGLRFYPVPEVIALNEPHYQSDVSKEWPVVFATTVEGGHRLCFDTTSRSEYPPVLLLPRGLDLKGKTIKQLKPKGRLLVPTLLQFWRGLPTGTLDLSPR